MGRESPPKKITNYTDTSDSKQSSKSSEIDNNHHQVHDYMKHHLLIKSCLDKERSLLRTGPIKKISIRNYTPKILGQEINMGMWM